MEPKRLKYLRSKIERISDENENKTQFCFVQPSTQRRSSVTLLESSSYHDQNKDLRILNTCDDKCNSDPERITNYEQEKQNSKNTDSGDNSINVITIDFERVHTQIICIHGRMVTSNRRNNVTQTFTTDSVHDTKLKAIKCSELTIIKSAVPYKSATPTRSKCIEQLISFKTQQKMLSLARLESLTESMYDEEFQKFEEENINPMNKPTKILELEEHEQNTKNPNKVDQVIAKPMAQDTVIEISNKNKTDSNESLQPTLTEIIPEKEMDILRKSLEEDNNAEEITTEIPNQAEDAPKKVRKSKRAVIQKSYLDFMSEDEDFVWDSTSWEGTDESSSDEDQPKKKKTVNAEDGKVGESGLKKKKENKAKKRKDSRSKGECYVKKDGSIRKERQLKPNPCIGKSCPWKCSEIDEEKRTGIFDYFWGLSNQRKKEWLIAMSSKEEVKRKRSKQSSYRTNTFKYFINDGEGRRQVCSKFLISTLDVTQRFVYYTLTNVSQGISKEDGRGRCVPANKTPDNVRESAKTFIKSLPALPSHYCRKDSTRLYLPTEFKNIKNLYRIYKEDQTSTGVDVLSEKIFRQIFNTDFNVGFHVPKKDKCLKCLRFEGQNLSECPELRAHLEEKQASKQRQECHRELGKENPTILCTSFDLQKVLNTPHGNSMLLFYSRKYTVYNLCFYESITRNGFCFVWGETEGKRGANEIGTILQKYIRDVDSRTTIKTLILYSDSCPGQNKNKIVLAAVHNALLQSKHLETIQMNFLLPGHTEMTVDSIHSTIEHSVRNTIVWAPSQWATVCQLARKEPAPYYVENLTHTDFKNFEEFSDKYFKGNLVGKISKIRTATFKKSTPNEIKIKYTMKNDALEEKIPIHAKPKSLNLKYKTSLAITKSKYNDLKKLCDTNVIPKIFHTEYLNLQTNNAKDQLVDTDIEDETEELD